MPALVLHSHCRSRPVPPPWCRVAGPTHVQWRDADGTVLDREPVIGETLVAVVAAPFATGEDGRFHTLWQPALAALNGMDTDPSALARLRIIEAELTTIGAPTNAEGRDGNEVLVRVHAVIAPESFLDEPAVATRLDGCLLTSRGKHIVEHDRWRLVDVSLEGDINYSYLLERESRSLVVMWDDSICQGFFYAGHGVVEPDVHAMVVG